jgi:hypothetical protein
MNAQRKVCRWQRQAQIRQALSYGLVGLPLLCGVVALARRFLPYHVAPALALLGAVSLALAIAHAVKARDRQWLVRQLDERRPDLENSSDLLFADPTGLGVLQKLQRQRTLDRLSTATAIDLRQPWPWKAIGTSILTGLLMIGAARYWPTAQTMQEALTEQLAGAQTQATAPVRLLRAAITVSPPAYTGLPVRAGNALSVKFPEGAALQWRLAFQPQPKNVTVVFFDGSRLALQRKGDDWLASRTLRQSNLYRIEVDGLRLAAGRRFRLDAIKDQAPQLKVMQPDRSHSLVELGQESWPLSIEASDDYGLGGAQLRIQLAQGTGENISFKEQTVALTGQGGQQRKRYAYRVDLGALGVGAGDDVIVQFAVSDRRAPQANTTRSASFILRWPPESGAEASGVEGMLKKVVPAYFRSQRQIIIDTEKLIAERGKLDRDGFELRSDNIGVDQRLLRLRYGQFLGEETETERPPPAAEGKDATDEAHSADDGHGHAEEKPKAKGDTGGSQAILEEFGHTHDIPEAATLLDPETKKLLRAALNEMWQAELHLRQTQPKLALPFEYRALALIKKVQQADRIYLARVGNELPPIDESRRLSGDRTGLAQREDWLSVADDADAALVAFWRALDVSGPQADGAAPDYAALQAWINANPARMTDSLSLLAALDDFQTQPDCAPCLLALKAQLWPLLQKPAAAPPRRPAGSRMGRAYLDALHKEPRP